VERTCDVSEQNDQNALRAKYAMIGTVTRSSEDDYRAREDRLHHERQERERAARLERERRDRHAEEQRELRRQLQIREQQAREHERKKKAEFHEKIQLGLCGFIAVVYLIVYGLDGPFVKSLDRKDCEWKQAAYRMCMRR
jgi:hypothetical protein